MSYVKCGIIKDGVLDVFEIHGSELIMSTKKRILGEIASAKEIYKRQPKIIEEHVSRLEKGLKTPSKYNSGIVQTRVRLGIAELDIEDQLGKWLAYLKRTDIPARADDNRGYPYNSIVDIDAKTFYSMQENWYATYQDYLPDGWIYKEISIEEMKRLVKKYPLAERHREKAKKLLEEMVASGDEHYVLHIENLKREYNF